MHDTVWVQWKISNLETFQVLGGEFCTMIAVCCWPNAGTRKDSWGALSLPTYAFLYMPRILFRYCQPQRSHCSEFEYVQMKLALENDTSPIKDWFHFVSPNVVTQSSMRSRIMIWSKWQMVFWGPCSCSIWYAQSCCHKCFAAYPLGIKHEITTCVTADFDECLPGSRTVQARVSSTHRTSLEKM